MTSPEIYQDAQVTAIMIEGSNTWEEIIQGSYKPVSVEVRPDVKIAAIVATERYSKEHIFLFAEALKAVRFTTEEAQTGKTSLLPERTLP